MDEIVLTKAQIDSWHEAIPRRHSVRSFTGEPLDAVAMRLLEEVASRLSGDAARAIISTEAIDRALQRVAGSYGKVEDVPAFAALTGNTVEPNYEEMCGYIGEALVLEAVSLGLGTCWVGGSFQTESVVQVIDLSADDRMLGVIALGYEALDHSFKEKEVKKTPRIHSRMELDEITGGIPRSEWPGWTQSALEAARLAPSAENRQPWRFDVAADSITVSLESTDGPDHISKLLDCGAAMLHLEVGAGHAGVLGRWEFLELPEIARFLVTGRISA